MIEKISLQKVATSGTQPSVMAGLAQLNFVYGANGSGKTTISRVIRDSASFATCSVSWEQGTPLKTYVYNRDFVAENFSESRELRGVFTLGKQKVDTETQLQTAKTEEAFLRSKIADLRKTLGDKQRDLSTLNDEFRQQCWNQKLLHQDYFSQAFAGFVGTKDRFRDKTLQVAASNIGTTAPLADLKKKADTLFGEEPILEPQIGVPSFESAFLHQDKAILQKKIIGKRDVDISALILRVSSSDWVKQGRAFLEQSHPSCPFCQQRVSETLLISMESFFDEGYEADISTLKEMNEKCRNDYEALLQYCLEVGKSASRYFDRESFETEIKLLESVLDRNLSALRRKIKEPSLVVAFESIADPKERILSYLEQVNESIRVHNDTVSNLSLERNNLKEEIWNFIAGDALKAEIASYHTRKKSVDQAMVALTEKITKMDQDIQDFGQKIRELQSEGTGVDATLIEINSILVSFGFTGFSMQKVGETTAYCLKRQDGSEAHATLSEGEKTFITFLYFYHLLKGGSDAADANEKRIVVFDDPVSSLDSDVLFMVSTLIKSLFEPVTKGTGIITQIFILTHNVYFHKELTFNARKKYSAQCETFWTVRKNGNSSELTFHTENPISTSYELLWEDVRKPDRSPQTIRNTLRRIIESYFKMWGHIDFDDITEKFEGQDKIVCNSLFAWAHDGSHLAQDDLYATMDASQIDSFLRVFRRIFDVMEQSGHYKMMMDKYFVEIVPAGLGVDPATSDIAAEIAQAN